MGCMLKTYMFWRSCDNPKIQDTMCPWFGESILEHLKKTNSMQPPTFFYQANFYNFFLLANQGTCVQLRAPKQFDNLLISFKQYFNIFKLLISMAIVRDFKLFLWMNEQISKQPLIETPDYFANIKSSTPKYVKQ